MNWRTKGIGLFAILVTSLLVYGATCATASVAVPQIPCTVTGTVTIGGTTAPSGVTVRADCVTHNYSTTTSGSGAYAVDIQFDDTDTTNVTEGITAGTACTLYVGSTAAGNLTPTAGNLVTGQTLAIAASCTDGISNGNETLTDCGGAQCGACLTVSSSVSLSATTSESASQNATGTISIASASASSSTPIIAVTLAAGALVNTQNSSDTLSMSVNQSSATVSYGATRSITLTAVIPANKTGTYTGNVTVANNYSGTLGNNTVSVTLAVSESTTLRRRTQYMDWELAGASAEGKYCIGTPVVITVSKTKDGSLLDKVDVDVYLAGKKAANALTDDNGQASFTPKAAGTYTINAQRSSYKELEETITVVDCGPVVPVTTTVKAAATTTVAAATTTVEEATTTIKAPTSTVKPAPTTTIAVAPPAKKGLPWMTIILVLIVIVVIAAVLKKKGGGKPAEAKK